MFLYLKINILAPLEIVMILKKIINYLDRFFIFSWNTKGFVNQRKNNTSSQIINPVR
jgi:hypothetical protein